MLRPRDSLTPERKSLAGPWRFPVDSVGEGSAGIHRPVGPYGTGSTHLDHITVFTGLDGGNGRIMNHRVFDRFEPSSASRCGTSPTLRRRRNHAGRRQQKGLFTRDRRPKQAAWELRRRWRGDS
jgi:hypothetical protein